MHNPALDWTSAGHGRTLASTEPGPHLPRWSMDTFQLNRLIAEKLLVSVILKNIYIVLQYSQWIVYSNCKDAFLSIL